MKYATLPAPGIESSLRSLFYFESTFVAVGASNSLAVPGATITLTKKTLIYGLRQTMLKLNAGSASFVPSAILFNSNNGTPFQSPIQGYVPVAGNTVPSTFPIIYFPEQNPDWRFNAPMQFAGGTVITLTIAAYSGSGLFAAADNVFSSTYLEYEYIL